jgi:membrane protein YqaA with SNARE-associated domain
MNVWRVLVTPRGDPRWDVCLRAAGVFALLGIPILLLVPKSAPLVWLAVLSIPANSPLSPLLPTAFEPLIMEAAKYAPFVWVTLVATAAYMYMEYVNWRVYAWVLNWERLAGFRARRSVQWGIRNFARSPFWTVVVFAFTPLPFWAGRVLAILHRYPLRRFMAATLVGRLPRFLFYAWFGDRVHVPTLVLVALIVGPFAFVIVSRLLRGVPLLGESVPPAEDPPVPAAEPPATFVASPPALATEDS